MTTVSTYEARQNLAKLLELAFYKGEKIKVERNKRAMAWIVGDPTMRAIEHLIDYIIEHEPALADTLAILMDKEIMEAIRQGTREVEEGKTIPLEKALEN